MISTDNLFKSSEMLCGSACTYFISKHLLKKDLVISNNLFWATDIAYFLKNHIGLNTKVSCFESNLYNDYLNNNLSKDFNGYKSINKFINSGGIIIQEPVNSNQIINSLQSGNVIIACVSSAIFNQDDNFTGGHFIIISDFTDNYFEVVNPAKNKYCILQVEMNLVINSLKSFGCWLIQVKL